MGGGFIPPQSKTFIPENLSGLPLGKYVGSKSAVFTYHGPPRKKKNCQGACEVARVQVLSKVWGVSFGPECRGEEVRGPDCSMKVILVGEQGPAFSGVGCSLPTPLFS